MCLLVTSDVHGRQDQLRLQRRVPPEEGVRHAGLDPGGPPGPAGRQGRPQLHRPGWNHRLSGSVHVKWL